MIVVEKNCATNDYETLYRFDEIVTKERLRKFSEENERLVRAFSISSPLFCYAADFCVGRLEKQKCRVLWRKKDQFLHRNRQITQIRQAITKNRPVQMVKSIGSLAKNALNKKSIASCVFSCKEKKYSKSSSC
jgi:hypothetical protein